MSDQMKFKRTLFGVSKKPVVEYLSNVSKSIEDKLLLKDSEISKLKNKIIELEKKTEDFNKQILDFEDEKKQISSVFIKAEETAKSIVKEAEERAFTILTETEKKVNETLSDLEREKEKRIHDIEKEISAQKSLLTNYKTETNYLREKIKITLEKFDELLENAIK